MWNLLHALAHRHPLIPRGHIFIRCPHKPFPCLFYPFFLKLYQHCSVGKYLLSYLFPLLRTSVRPPRAKRIFGLIRMVSGRRYFFFPCILLHFNRPIIGLRLAALFDFIPLLHCNDAFPQNFYCGICHQTAICIRFIRYLIPIPSLCNSIAPILLKGCAQPKALHLPLPFRIA